MTSGKWLGRLAMGLAAGAAGTAAMNAYWTGLSAMKGPEGSELESKEEPTTAKVARRAMAKVGIRHPSSRVRKIGGEAVHWGYGSLWGGLAGLTGRFGVPLYWGGGQMLGAGLWALGDIWLLYRMGFAKHPREYPVRVHLEALGAHLVYGASLWAALRAMEIAAEKLTGERVEEPYREAA